MEIETIGILSANLDIPITVLSRAGQLSDCLSTINTGARAVSGRAILNSLKQHLLKLTIKKNSKSV